jgi:hypothetical protein
MTLYAMTLVNILYICHAIIDCSTLVKHINYVTRKKLGPMFVIKVPVYCKVFFQTKKEKSILWWKKKINGKNVIKYRVCFNH